MRKPLVMNTIAPDPVGRASRATTIGRGKEMRKLFLGGAVAACMFVVAVPAASADSTIAFTATYHAKFAGHSGTPSCPNGETACGAGSSPQLGSFTYALFAETPQTQLVVLTFTDGTLVLDESFGSATTPGRSVFSHESPKAFGNPVVFTSPWTVDSASTLAVTGAGTDVEHVAGLAEQGDITGVLTPAS